MKIIILCIIIAAGYAALWYFYGRNQITMESVRKPHPIHLVVAGNANQYRYWVDMNFEPEQRKYARYVRTAHDMRGYEGAVVHWIGTYDERKDISELEQIAAQYSMPSPSVSSSFKA